ncbi:hypothetical protein VE03_01390 [Pseudogymnoascus sp. 23342-1-I1]|nr:hypothetical protein VE03_01390 [Pseudogymnoascus sp. 23342-1-I1]
MKFFDKTPAPVIEVEDDKPKDSFTQDVRDTDYVSGTDEEKRLLLKIDLYLLPSIWFMYLFSYMDRTNIGNAKVAGMSEDLGLDSAKYSTTLVVFFVGYVIFEIPSNMLLARSRPSRFLPTIMFLWGCLTIGMAFVKTYKDLLVYRVVIGCLEAGFAPGVLMLLSSWYRKEEQSKRFAIYISASILSGAFGGLMAGAITGTMDGKYGIAGWRWLFIIEGAMTSAWAIIAAFFLLDFPASTRKLNERERELAVARIASQYIQSGTEDRPLLSHSQAFKEAVTNWRTWVFTAGYMVIVGSLTLSYFYPTLVKGLGYTANEAQYMTVPIYASSFVCTAVTSYFMDKAPDHRGVVVAGWLSLSMICSVATCAVYDFKARYVLLVFIASGLWACNALALSYSSSTFGSMPNETRAIALAIVNALGNLSQIYGSYLFPSEDAPKYIKGFGVISGMCLVGVIV